MSRYMLLMLPVLALMGCSGRVPIVKAPRGVNCIGTADDLKTLRVGDELPRVVQVLGMPNNAYRAFSPFGRSYDVLEYDTGKTACAKVILHSKTTLKVVFDDKGQYVGNGDSTFFKLRRATTVRVEPLLIDADVLKP